MMIGIKEKDSFTVNQYAVPTQPDYNMIIDNTHQRLPLLTEICAVTYYPSITP